MLDYTQFIGQQIVNKDGQIGKVIVFNKERIKVGYEKEEKLYSPDIAFKCGAIKFVEGTLNQLINQDIEDKDKTNQVKEQKVAKINQEAKVKIKKAIDRYKELDKKVYILKQLFGQDFIYPPMVEFQKKYPYIVAEVEADESWAATLRRIRHMDCND